LTLPPPLLLARMACAGSAERAAACDGLGSRVRLQSALPSEADDNGNRRQQQSRLRRAQAYSAERHRWP
jgi:hypothetical protein